MKITFGRVPEHLIDEGESFIGKDSEGNNAEFYYVLDIKEEQDNNGMFTIRDTCDRYMPFDFDQLDELSEIINQLKNYRDDKIKFSNYWKTAWGFAV